MPLIRAMFHRYFIGGYYTYKMKFWLKNEQRQVNKKSFGLKSCEIQGWSKKEGDKIGMAIGTGHIMYHTYVVWFECGKQHTNRLTHSLATPHTDRLQDYKPYIVAIL